MTKARRVARGAAVVAFLAALVVGGALYVQGWRLYAVASGSMLPTFEVGDLVVVAPSDDLAAGDVITYPSVEGSRHAVTTHRVIEVEGTQLVTQGDANEVADTIPVPADDVVGEVVASAPRAGYAVVFLQQPAGVGSIMTVLLSVILLWGLFFPDDAAAPPQEVRSPARRTRDAAPRTAEATA